MGVPTPCNINSRHWLVQPVVLVGVYVTLRVVVTNKGNVRLRNATINLPWTEEGQYSCVFQPTLQPGPAQAWPWLPGSDVDVDHQVVCHVSHWLTPQDLVFAEMMPNGAARRSVFIDVYATWGQTSGNGTQQASMLGMGHTVLMVAALPAMTMTVDPSLCTGSSGNESKYPACASCCSC